MADESGGNRPNRPLRPRQGARAAAGASGGSSSTPPPGVRVPTRGRRVTAPVVREPKAPAAPPTGPVTVASGASVKDLSQALGVPMSDLIKILMDVGVMRTATQSVSDEEVELIAAALKPPREITIKHAADEELEPEDYEDAEEDLADRAARRHDHGPRRPRQDDAARRHPRDVGGRHRGRRHHAAHRRLPGRDGRPPDHVPRHAGPRGVHRHARPRREGDGHRRARRRGRRRRHAADEGVDLARPRRRGADRRRREQGRPARREPRQGEERARVGGPAAGGVGRYDAVLRGLRAREAEPRRPAREGAARRRRRARAEGEPEGRGFRADRRVTAGRRPRPRGDDAHPPRHAQRR